MFDLRSVFFERRPERTNRAAGGSFEIIGAWRGAAKTAETRGGSASWAAWQLTADGPRAAAAAMASPGNGQAAPRRRARRPASGRQRPGDPAPRRGYGDSRVRNRRSGRGPTAARELVRLLRRLAFLRRSWLFRPTLVRNRAFSRPRRSTCEYGKADSLTDRRNTGRDGSDRTGHPPRYRSSSSWIGRPIPKRILPDRRETAPPSTAC